VDAVITLALDTSHPVGTVALAIDGESRGHARFGDAGSHLVELGSRVDAVLGASGLTIADVDRVALTNGPGSFTGLRIGMAFVKGLAAAREIEVVTVGSLELLAVPLLGDHEYVCPMIDARKNEVYTAVFARPKAPAGRPDEVVSSRVADPAAFLEESRRYQPLFVGSGALRYRDTIAAIPGAGEVAGSRHAQPSTIHLAVLADRLRPLDRRELRDLEPLYIRSSDAELKRLRPVDPHG
jgi:tRNA threonylcarbamoyladenosine biosynthesis protein TsaB